MSPTAISAQARLPGGGLEVRDHWSRLFAAERALLDACLAEGQQASAFLIHIGATAVPGIPARPIIDMVLVADSTPPLLNPMLRNAGYQPVAANNNGVSQWQRRLGQQFAYRIYGVDAKNAFWKEALAIRERLLYSPPLRRQYGQLKYYCAHLFGFHSVTYHNACQNFRQQVLSGSAQAH